MNRQHMMTAGAAAVGVFLVSLYRSGGEVLSSLLAAIVIGAGAYGVLWALARRKG